jgi:AcrR family transcriptional regulator
VTTAPAPLSRDRILRCALSVADRDGLDATSLRRVAGELGVHVTSLYHHVPTKEALLDGVVEELLGSAALPLEEVTWEQWVRTFVDQVALLAQQHPGAFAVLMRRPVQGPRATATFEVGLAAFTRAGLDPGEAYACVKTVALAVLGCCLERAEGVAGQEGLRTDLDGLSWQDFPVLHQVTAVAEDVDLVATLREVLVAGFAARIG